MCLGIEFYIRVYLVPSVLKLIALKTAIEKAAGIGQEVGHYELGPLLQCPHYMAIHKSFRKVHMITAMGNIVAIMCSAFHLYFLSYKYTIRLNWIRNMYRAVTYEIRRSWPPDEAAKRPSIMKTQYRRMAGLFGNFVAGRRCRDTRCNNDRKIETSIRCKIVSAGRRKPEDFFCKYQLIVIARYFCRVLRLYWY